MIYHTWKSLMCKKNSFRSFFFIFFYICTLYKYVSGILTLFMKWGNMNWWDYFSTYHYMWGLLQKNLYIYFYEKNVIKVWKINLYFGVQQIIISLLDMNVCESFKKNIFLYFFSCLNFFLLNNLDICSKIDGNGFEVYLNFNTENFLHI